MVVGCVIALVLDVVMVVVQWWWWCSRGCPVVVVVGLIVPNCTVWASKSAAWAVAVSGPYIVCSARLVRNK